MLVAEAWVTVCFRPNAGLAWNAAVWTATSHLMVPESLVGPAGARILCERKVLTPKGQLELLPYAGPFTITVEGRTACVGAVIHDAGIILGRIVLDSLGLKLERQTERLVSKTPIPV